MPSSVHRRFVALAFVLAACGAAKNKEPASPPGLENAAHHAAASPTGVVVVFEAHHLWLGNDTWWTGRKASTTEGYYKPLTAALGSLASAALPGAKAAMISYGFGATVLWQGDLKDLTGDEIGTQKSLSMVQVPQMATETNPNGDSPEVGLDLQAGLQAALDVLTAMTVDHKVLIVIGDGTHAGDADLSALRAAKVEIHAIGIESLLATAMDFAGDPGAVKKLDASAQWLDSPDQLGPAVAAIAAGLTE